MSSWSRLHRSPGLRLALLVAGTALLLGAVAAPATAATPVKRLPDLRMRVPTNFVLQDDNGRRLLRLTTTVMNTGDGPFELVARRASQSDSTMTVRQRIQLSDGTWTSRATNTLANYATDGHDHWHIQRVVGMELYTLAGQGVRTGEKVGFCFYDELRFSSQLPRSPTTPHYLRSGCGVSSSLHVRMGLSVGWGDVYHWGVAYQWIDVTGVPAGEYRVRVQADPRHQFVESREGNNCAWALIRIPAEGSQVTVVGTGQGCQVSTG